VENLILPKGYRFAGIHAGIKPEPSRLDLGLLISDRPATAVGLFTQNRVVAAPVRISQERVPTADARGIVMCSGNANACAGEQGKQDARRMTAIAADSIGCKPEQLLVCSTGVIGRRLPMEVIEPGIRKAARNLGTEAAAFENLAHAILTTDTRIKVSSRSVSTAGQDIHVTGFAKGAAMIGPNLATMLAFVFTDAAVAPRELTTLARKAVDASFHCISIEGHTSTNDTVLFFANGAANERLTNLDSFQAAATAVCADLARAIATDAEGAAHLVTIEIEGLQSDAEARQVAKTIADSPLVKTAIFGADPNWGRFVSAAGYSGVDFQEEDLSLWLGDMLLYKRGAPQPFDPVAAAMYLKQNREIHLRLQFHDLGSGHCIFWTCDLTHDYVRLNAEYTT
jgi:glutamate N-acetyltransferase/amino-acid N-acetyltransferase